MTSETGAKVKLHVEKTLEIQRHLDMVKPIPKSSDPAPLKLDYRSIVSTETLNPRCKNFVVSTDVINIISLHCSKQRIKIRLSLKKFRCLGGFPGALAYLAWTGMYH